ncbi:MAG: type II toxin-antitoxin system HicB family antitoxin [Tepidiformaceae bacterium]
MRNEFTAILHETEGWWLAFSPEMPAANGQGKTREAAKESLAQAIDLLLEDLREDGALRPEARENSPAVAG